MRPPSARVSSLGITQILFAVALGDLRQHLQVLVGEELRVGLPLVDRLEDRLDRLRLPLGGEDRGLLLALGLQDRRLLLALGRAGSPPA